MYKQILVLFAIVVVVKSQTNNSSLRADDYIAVNRRNYAKNIENYDGQMEIFKQNNADRMNTIDIELDMLLDILNQNDERLNALELLSDASQRCVKKYRSLIPTTASVKASIKACITTANTQLNTLLNTPISTRNTLQNYYTNNFERDIANCNKTYGNLPLNYTMCITSVITTTNTYTINNQKTFATQMEAAQCSSNAIIKKALDCYFTVLNRTISLVAEVNTNITRCLNGLDDCDKCNQGYMCSDSYNLRKSQVDYRNATMVNVFYGRNNQTSDCLMLKIN